jgi:DNA-binding HxlR family transcriptional regulator
VRCGQVSSSVLNDRLTELRAAGIVDAGDDGYALTPEGRKLLEAYRPLDAWAQRWAKRT